MYKQPEKAYKYLLSLAALFMAVLFCVPTLRAQNDVLLTQSWAVPTYYNPATTGQVDFLRIRGGARLQWIGIDNAPKSFLATADMPVKIGKKRIGVGADMMNESLGLFSNTLINIQASYKIKFLKGTLSIGVQGGYYTSKFKGSEVVLPEGDDYHQGT
ncbi:MAG: PorP/SprF family type IX secretion system membrane protein, partial [Bacteroides sp.]|nr:PorP/SprF family type IX secretion system membrane protein [Bacteroides sp.]